MFAELSNQIKAQLYDRVKSPLFSTFLLSWMAWNFRTLIIFVSDAELDTKLFNLDLLYPTLSKYLTHGLAFPFLTATAFILLYPYPAKIAYWHWHNQHLKIKKIQQQIEDQTPITQEEAIALRKTSLEQQISLQNQIRILSDTNREFSNRENQLLEKLDSIREQLTAAIAAREELATGNGSLRNQIEALEEELKNISTYKVEPFNTGLANGFLFELSKRLEPSEQNLTLSKTLKEYCEDYGVSDDMLSILFALVLLEERNTKANILNILNNDLSSIELDSIVNRLKARDFAVATGDKVFLTDKAKDFVVNSNLTKITKLLKNETKTKV